MQLENSTLADELKKGKSLREAHQGRLDLMNPQTTG